MRFELLGPYSLGAEVMSAVRKLTDGDTLKLFELILSSALSVEFEEFDGTKSYDYNLDVLSRYLRECRLDLRRLALVVERSPNKIKLGFIAQTEIRMGDWASHLWGGALAIVSVGLMVILIVYASRLVLDSKPNNAPVIYGKLIKDASATYVQLLRQGTEIGSTRELVLLPDRGSWLSGLDLCHLAVLLEPATDHNRSKATGKYRVLDLYFDGSLCSEPLDTFLKSRWGVDLDVAKYPSTHLRRAASELLEAEKEADKRLKEQAYLRARSAYQSAEQLLRNAAAPVTSHDTNLERRLMQIAQDRRGADYLANSVTSRPRHEMIHVSSGYSYRITSSGRQNIMLPDFWLDRFEVSNSQFEQLNTSHQRGDSHDDNTPVLGVSWSEAQRYCEQRGLRLPTEDEFEKAAVWDANSNAVRQLDENKLFQLAHTLHAVQDDLSGGSPYNSLNLLGNAAEWTIRKIPRGNTPLYFIKGGSYLARDASELSPWRALVGTGSAVQDVGFRCAASMRPTASDWLLIREN